VNDQILPLASDDRESPHFLWDNTPDAPLGDGALEAESQQSPRPAQGIRWLQYDFDSENEFSESAVYWSAAKPGGHGNARLPRSFRIFYLNDGQWQRVKPEMPAPIADQLQRIDFPAMRTKSIRLEVTPSEKAPSGLYEWCVR